MVNYKQVMKNSALSKNTAFALALVFCTNMALPNIFAQTITTNQNLLAPALKSEAVNLVGIKTYSDNPFKFDFLINEGNSKFDQNQLKEESLKLARYFLAGLATPSRDLWVNLQPGQSGRIIPNAFASTEMGEDMLAQDYILKRLAASLTYPESEIGKKYWDEINNVGANNHSPVHQNLNRIWIVPESAVIYEDGAKAYLTESKLKVMMEEDYLGARNQELPPTPSLAKRGSDQANAFKSQILPLIEKEVNTGAHFAKLRQIYHALLLAAWYKNRLNDSPLYKIYVNKNKTRGIDFTDDNASQQVYGKYMDNFKNGEYKIIQKAKGKRQNLSGNYKIISRQYFSGGVSGENVDRVAEEAMHPLSQMPPQSGIDKPTYHLTVLDTPAPEIYIPEPVVEPLTAEQQKVRRLEWALEHMEYRDIPLEERLQGKYNTITIQNNANQDRPIRCNGNCYYCLDLSKNNRRLHRTSPPMTREQKLKMIQEKVDEIIALGIPEINIAGNETFQDLESFWAIIDACRNKPIKVEIVTNGIYFLQNDPAAFFQMLKTRLGKVKSIQIGISWDPHKVSYYSRHPALQGIGIMAGMKKTVEAFKAKAHNTTVPINLVIYSHDAETANPAYKEKIIRDFFAQLTSAGSDEKVTQIYRPALPYTPQSLRAFIARGKAHNADIARRWKYNEATMPSGLAPEIDLASGTIALHGSGSLTYQRRDAAKKLVETMGKIFHTPYMRHRNNNDAQPSGNERLENLMAIAYTLKPQLEKMGITRIEQLEYYMLDDEAFMSKLERLILLFDMVNTAQGGLAQAVSSAIWPNQYNLVKKVPRELAEAALEPEIVQAFIQYNIELKSDRPASRLVNGSRDKSVTAITQILKSKVINKLKGNGVITSEALPPMSDTFAKRPFINPEAELPEPGELKKMQERQMLAGLKTNVPAKERRIALNLFGLLASLHEYSPRYKNLLEENIEPARFNEGEQLEILHILNDWVRNGSPDLFFRETEEQDEHARLVINIMQRFLNSQSINARHSAAEMIIAGEKLIPSDIYNAVMVQARAALKDTGPGNTAPPATPSVPDTPQTPPTPVAAPDAAAETQGGVNFDIQNQNVIKTRGTFNTQAQNKCPYPENITGLTVQFVDFEKI